MTVRINQRVALLLFIFTLAGLLRTSSAQKQKPQFKVQVNLVFLDVEALDRKGNPVTDLDRNDFRSEGKRLPGGNQ